MLVTYTAVTIGGIIGVWIRFSVMQWSGFQTFTMPTLIVNALGCFIMGIMVALSEQWSIPEPLKLGVLVGCCGALTTFSTIVLDIMRLLSQQAFTQAVYYFVSTNLFGVTLFGLGFILTAKLVKWMA